MTAPRDTTTGRDFEDVVEIAVKRSGQRNNFTGTPQQVVGEKPGGGRHVVDWELVDNADPDRRGLVSCKFQGTSGTAEEKLAYEVMKLLHTMDNDARYVHGWILMGGDGWSPGMRDFVRNQIAAHVPGMVGRITIIDSTDLLLTQGLALP